MTPSGPNENRRAVIDIGSNSVKLLVADVVDGVVTSLVHESEQTRLGRGVFETGLLEQEAVLETTRVASHFAARARDAGAEGIRVLGTSAARDAHNADDLARALAAENLVLEILDGHTEAGLVLRGVRSHPDLAAGRLALMDVGGGSTELLVADGEDLKLVRSFQLGTVRLLSGHPTADDKAKLTETLGNFLDEKLVPTLGRVSLPGMLVGAGGTPVFLARVLKETDNITSSELESTRLSLSEVQTLNARLWAMPLEQRRRLPGLPANRADVILIGSAIYEAVMLRCGFAELRPTLRGVRYGALLA
ncbi:MAG: phosphatase [Verrucomicrobiales bacterium]|nr:phosphatase [Verrucomicrobiales bacterium]|tara:strand:+ start:2627 stop:3544 length:918 start_codon:yes stop_codon:yes gene_type:complete